MIVLCFFLCSMILLIRCDGIVVLMLYSFMNVVCMVGGEFGLNVFDLLLNLIDVILFVGKFICGCGWKCIGLCLSLFCVLNLG